MKTTAIIQARMSSTRLPGKVLKEICGKPLIWHVVDRLGFASLVDEIVIATSVSPPDDQLINWCKTNKVQYFRGSEENVLSRYYQCASSLDSEIVVRVTADDPFKDPDIIDEAIRTLAENNYDFVTNNNPPTFPEGLDVEVMTFEALDKCNSEAESDYEKEHVTQYILKNPEIFRIKNITNNENKSHLRWTIDTKEDLVYVEKVYNELFEEGKIFKSENIYRLLEKNRDLNYINNQVERSSQYKDISYE